MSYKDTCDPSYSFFNSVLSIQVNLSSLDFFFNQNQSCSNEMFENYTLNGPCCSLGNISLAQQFTYILCNFNSNNQFRKFTFNNMTFELCKYNKHILDFNFFVFMDSLNKFSLKKVLEILNKLNSQYYAVTFVLNPDNAVDILEFSCVNSANITDMNCSNISFAKSNATFKLIVSSLESATSKLLYLVYVFSIRIEKENIFQLNSK